MPKTVTANVLSRAVLTKIRLERRDLHKTWGTLSICGDISRYCCLEFGWAVKSGKFVGPVNNEDPHFLHGGHCWNVLKDGTIVDASADQYGHAGILVIVRNDDRRKWYRYGVTIHRSHKVASYESL